MYKYTVKRKRNVTIATIIFSIKDFSLNNSEFINPPSYVCLAILAMLYYTWMLYLDLHRKGVVPIEEILH